MFKFWRDGTTANYQGSFDTMDMLDSFMVQKLKNEIVAKVSEAWIEEHGAELLDNISPDEVEKAIKQAVAKRIMGKE